MSLTTLQELFVRALLSDPKRNATAAAVAAGYSARRAKKTARELMDDPEVQLALHEKQLAALEGANVERGHKHADQSAHEQRRGRGLSAKKMVIVLTVMAALIVCASLFWIERFTGGHSSW